MAENKAYVSSLPGTDSTPGILLRDCSGVGDGIYGTRTGGLSAIL